MCGDVLSAPGRPVARSLLNAVSVAVFATSLVACAATESRSTATGAPHRLRAWDGIAEPVWSSDAYGGPEVERALIDIARVGARTVTLVPTWYVDDTTASVPARDPEQTATDASLRTAIAVAHREGLQVLLKPHVDRHDGGDRAEIVPADPAAWFAAYRAMIVAYAALANETRVERFAVGTELAGTMGSPDEWLAIIAAVRGAYGGELTYAANFDSYDQVPFWDRLDVIGIDAYFELADRPTTDVAVLEQAWTPILDEIQALATGLDRPVAFTEAGYVSQRGATTQPWNWELGPDGGAAPRSDEEQLAGYRALLRAVRGRSWFRGVQWWMWDDLADTGEVQETDYTPHGKAAGALLRRVWRNGEAP